MKWVTKKPVLAAADYLQLVDGDVILAEIHSRARVTPSGHVITEHVLYTLAEPTHGRVQPSVEAAMKLAEEGVQQ